MKYAVDTTVTKHATLLVEADTPEAAAAFAWELCHKVPKGART